MRTRWPWISLLTSLVLTLNPLGFDVVRSAFFASEALSRNIWAPLALTAMALMALAIVVEWLIRTAILRRRLGGLTS